MSWMKTAVFWSKLTECFFARVPLIVRQHKSRQWLGDKRQAIISIIDVLVYWHIYTPICPDEFNKTLGYTFEHFCEKKLSNTNALTCCTRCLKKRIFDPCYLSECIQFFFVKMCLPLPSYKPIYVVDSHLHIRWATAEWTSSSTWLQ